MSRLPRILHTSMAITISNYLGWERRYDLLSAPIHSGSCRLYTFDIFFWNLPMIYAKAKFNRLINSFLHIIYSRSLTTLQADVVGVVVIVLGFNLKELFPSFFNQYLTLGSVLFRVPSGLNFDRFSTRSYAIFFFISISNCGANSGANSRFNTRGLIISKDLFLVYYLGNFCVFMFLEICLFLPF